MMKVINSLGIMLFSVMMVSAQERGDVIINEILFNPTKDGFDYVEIYNRSSYSIPLSSLILANRNVTGDLPSFKAIKDTLFLLAHSYAVFTPNEKWLRMNYNVKDTTSVIAVASLPSLPDDEGSVVLLRRDDTAVIDELGYKEKWHFKLLSDVSGIALERINPEMPTQNENNWTSASSSSGYGTPGYVNSQFKVVEIADRRVSVLPKVISPDNNGIDDFAVINISANGNGNVANAVIYDVAGRRIRYLLKNVLLGMHDMFVWDGYDDGRQPAPMGIYILYTQIFDMSGNNVKFKNCIVVDRKR